MNKLTTAHVALVHLEAACDGLQALHDLNLPESIKRTVILAQKVNRGIADDVKAQAGIKDDKAVILSAFPRSTQRHLKPKVSYRHHVQR